jgi:hypothetical protein
MEAALRYLFSKSRKNTFMKNQLHRKNVEHPATNFFKLAQTSLIRFRVTAFLDRQTILYQAQSVTPNISQKRGKFSGFCHINVATGMNKDGQGARIRRARSSSRRRVGRG